MKPKKIKSAIDNYADPVIVSQALEASREARCFVTVPGPGEYLDVIRIVGRVLRIEVSGSGLLLEWIPIENPIGSMFNLDIPKLFVKVRTTRKRWFKEDEKEFLCFELPYSIGILNQP